MLFKRFLFFTIIAFFPLFGAGFEAPWGKDAALFVSKTEDPRAKSKACKREGFLYDIAEGVIAFHRDVISPVDGPRSHFRPTSSRYMLIAIREHGLVRGYLEGCDRLLRENNDPWVYRKIAIDGVSYKWDKVKESP